MKGMCFAKHRSWYTANSKRQRIATVSRYSWALEKENIWSWNRPSVRGTDSKNRSCCNECGLLYWESEAPWETDSLEVSCSSEFRNVCLHAHLKSRVFASLCYCQTPLLFSLYEWIRETWDLDCEFGCVRTCSHICQRHFSRSFSYSASECMTHGTECCSRRELLNHFANYPRLNHFLTTELKCSQ